MRVPPLLEEKAEHLHLSPYLDRLVQRRKARAGTR